MNPNNKNQIRYYAHTDLRDFQLSSLGTRDNRNARNYLESIMQFLLPLLQRPADWLLEIGTGTGFHAELCIAEYGVRYLGSDISLAQLKRTRQRLDGQVVRPPLVCCEAERLPFRRETLAAIYFSGTLHHTSNPAQCIAECSRVLKPAGRLALMEPNPLFPLNAVFAAVQRVERHMFQMSLHNLRCWMEDAGLKVIALGPHMYTPPTPQMLWKVYDWLDVVLSRIPIVRRFSLMHFCFGQRATDIDLMKPGSS